MFNDLALDQNLIRRELVAVPWVRFGGGSDDLPQKKPPGIRVHRAGSQLKIIETRNHTTLATIF